MATKLTGTGQRKFDVYVGNAHVDTVYFDDPMSAREVRRSLIEHDNWHANISVYRNALGRCAYDDMARASHPEEC